jgi:hypothetical protein
MFGRTQSRAHSGEPRLAGSLDRQHRSYRVCLRVMEVAQQLQCVAHGFRSRYRVAIDRVRTVGAACEATARTV